MSDETESLKLIGYSCVIDGKRSVWIGRREDLSDGLYYVKFTNRNNAEGDEDTRLKISQEAMDAFIAIVGKLPRVPTKFVLSERGTWQQIKPDAEL